ncbi:MAG: sugar ABC transporter permease [Spirochaetales bacterium]|nr:sugar ABC transporter permease [Spirochaetales bacterium]
MKIDLNRKGIKENLLLYAILSPVIVYIIIFCYVPMYGLIIAFQNFLPGSKFLSLGPSVRWVGLKHFIDFMSSLYFWRLIRNTLVLSGLMLTIGFMIPIVFALLLNEVRSLHFKKFIQTASYLPYFISQVVVASMVLTLVAKGGLVNRVFDVIGLAPMAYTTDPNVFPWVYVVSNIWKGFGWSSVIYMAAISGIDPALYEAAKIDGANRYRQILHITLPAISGTIFILLIFAIGGLLNANSEFILLMYNPAIYETSDVIGTYSYRVGIQGGQFSKTAAIGMFMQVINFTLLYVANAVSRKVNGFSLW